MNFQFGPIVNLIGHALTILSDHMIPIPVAREYMMAFGRGLSGAPFLLNPNWRDRQSRSLRAIGDYYIHDHIDRFVNGMGNYEADNRESGRSLSGFLGGRFVHLFYNATRGLMTDISETAWVMLGFETESVIRLRGEILKDLDNLSPNGTLRIYAHSMGGALTHKALEGLSEEQLGMIGVHTFGTARVIYNKYLRHCTNTICLGDPIPFITDPVGCLKGMFGMCNVKFVLPKSPFFIEHAFLGGAYEEELRRICSESVQRHGG